MTLCNSLWDPHSQLYVNRFMQKGLSADTSAAYGLLGFLGNNPRMKLVLTGTFPQAQYMSFQIYRGKPIQSNFGVGNGLIDYNIDPLPGTGSNPFVTHDPGDTGKFQIEITPDPAAINGEKRNSIWYDPMETNGPMSVITAFYRIYQPYNTITLADLPKVEARDYQTNAPISCPQSERLDWYLNVPIVDAIYNSAPEKNPFNFFPPPAFFASGTNENITYRVSWSKIPIGSVAVIRFRAPAIDFASPNVGATKKCVRYWSICPVYVANLKTFNGVASDPTRPNERDVTVVFGPDSPQDRSVREKARLMNAEFLPDSRSSSEEVTSFFLRHVLPSDALKPNEFDGPFLPQGKVYTKSQFLELP